MGDYLDLLMTYARHLDKLERKLQRLETSYAQLDLNNSALRNARAEIQRASRDLNVKIGEAYREEKL